MNIWCIYWNEFTHKILLGRETHVFRSNLVLKVMLSCFSIINYIAAYYTWQRSWRSYASNTYTHIHEQSSFDSAECVEERKTDRQIEKKTHWMCVHVSVCIRIRNETTILSNETSTCVSVCIYILYASTYWFALFICVCVRIAYKWAWTQSNLDFIREIRLGIPTKPTKWA